MVTNNATGAELAVADKNWIKMDALIKTIAVARVAVDKMGNCENAAACARLLDVARETTLGLLADAWKEDASHA